MNMFLYFLRQTRYIQGLELFCLVNKAIVIGIGMSYMVMRYWIYVRKKENVLQLKAAISYCHFYCRLTIIAISMVTDIV